VCSASQRIRGGGNKNKNKKNKKNYLLNERCFEVDYKIKNENFEKYFFSPNKKCLRKKSSSNIFLGRVKIKKKYVIDLFCVLGGVEPEND
jgi:hypothetical protein